MTYLSLSLKVLSFNFFSACSIKSLIEFFSIFFKSFAVDVKIKRLLSENSTVPSSTKYFFFLDFVPILTLVLKK